MIKIITAIILPPFNVLILLFFALLFQTLQWHKLRNFCAVIAIAVLYVFSIPYTSQKLEQYLITEDNLSLNEYKSAQAIVLLGGGIRDNKEIYSKIAVSSMGLERMRYAAYLQKNTELPLLITGSASNGNPEATFMAKELETFFNVPTKWLETKAKNTQENLEFSREILLQANVKKIILVTHQWHMPRAKLLFERAGFEVLPASIGNGIVPESYALHTLHFIPQAGALNTNSNLLREYIGYWKEKHFGK